MAFPVLKTLSILVVFLVLCGLQVDCKVEKYPLKVVENGTSVDEEVEVDEEEQTEVIRVAKHGDVNKLELLNDFNAGLTARLDEDNNVCYVSKLDSSFPSPEEMKQEMEQVSEQSQPDEETTESSEWRVVGPINSTTLPEKIVDFCRDYPIYEIEIEENPLENSTETEESGQTRAKRSIGYGFCSYGDQFRRDYCLRRGGYYRLTYQWEYRRYCSYICTRQCRYYGWFWGRRRVCRYVLRYNCNFIRYYVRCVSVTCCF